MKILEISVAMTAFPRRNPSSSKGTIPTLKGPSTPLIDCYVEQKQYNLYNPKIQMGSRIHRAFITIKFQSMGDQRQRLIWIELKRQRFTLIIPEIAIQIVIISSMSTLLVLGLGAEMK